MRFVILAVLGLTLLAAAPAMATLPGSESTAGGTSSTSHNFGGLDCPQHVPCPDDSDALSSDEYGNLANACMSQSFGVSSSGGFFETYKGLDSNSCLSTKSNAALKLTSNPTEPHCCITKTTNRSCVMHCDLVLVH